MMNTPTKKFLVSGGALVVLVLVSCGLTGCNWFGNSDGNQSNSSVTDTNTAEIPGLPPDPGEAGKATLAGIDSDNDGVRDDIQRYIAMTYQNSAKTRAALTQVVKVKQSALIDSGDKQKSVRHGEEFSKASECITYVLGDDVAAVDTGYRMLLDLKPVILNTDARNNAYFAYEDQLGGEIFSGTPNSQISSTCNFNTTTLPN